MNYSNYLHEWFQINQRKLPWRKTKEPYQIWISEVILQQTRVVQALEHYTLFITRFPTLHDLAQASEDEVLKAWQGLGYYSRARNLHITSKILVDKYNGIFPVTCQELKNLKGIGEYTASAIASIAFNHPVPAIDGNVIRVISRLLGISQVIDSAQGKKIIKEKATLLLDSNNPGMHNQALMEFGALQCTPKNPDCPNCIFQTHCYAFQYSDPGLFPVKKKGKKSINRYFNYLIIECNGFTYLNKRIKNDIWMGLYEPVLIETVKETNIKLLKNTIQWHQIFNKTKPLILKSLVVNHKLTHQIINTNLYYIMVNEINPAFEVQYIKIEISRITEYPVSRLVENFIIQILQNENML